MNTGASSATGWRRGFAPTWTAGGDPGRLGELQRRIDIVKISIDIFTDRLADAGRNAAQWLSGAGADDPFNVAAASGSEGIYFSSAFMFPEARRSAQIAREAAFQPAALMPRAGSSP